MHASSLIGQLRTHQGADDPYRLYAAMVDEHGPLVSDDRYTLVLSYAEADHVLRHPQEFPAAPQSGFANAVGVPAGHPRPAASMLRADGDAHDRMRAALSPAFAPRRIGRLSALIDRCVQEVVEPRLVAGGAVEFMAEIGYKLPITVICELLGIPRSVRQDVRALAHRRTIFLEPEPEPSQIADAADAGREVTELLTSLVRGRRVHPREDVISELLPQTGPGGALSGAELLANLSLLLVAGFETTANLLGNALALLLTHPEVHERLRTEPELAPRFVAEAARYDPAVQIVARTVTAPDVRIGEHHVPVGNMVMVMIGAAHRDAARFASPDDFAPFTRKAGGGNLAFGAGPHYCLGAGLARREAEALVRALVDPRWRVTPAEAPTRTAGRLAIRGYESMPIAIR